MFSDIAARETLSDHLIRPRQHIRRDRQADLLGRFQIDDQFELLSTKMAAPETSCHVGSVRHQDTALDKIYPRGNRRKSISTYLCILLIQVFQKTAFHQLADEAVIKKISRIGGFRSGHSVG